MEVDIIFKENNYADNHLRTQPETAVPDLENRMNRLESGIHNLLIVCNRQSDMLQCLLRELPSEHLEKSKIYETDAQAAVMSEGSIDIMAKEHRIRVCIGYDENGDPIIKRLSASDEIALADKVVEAMVKSGRIREFLNQEIVYSPREIQAAQSEPAPAKTNFKDYILKWRRTFKQGKAANTEVFMNAKQNVLLRWFAEMNIEDIKPSDVQDFLEDRAKQCKRATVKADLAMLKEVLDSAVEDGIIARNPAKDKRVHNPAKAGEGTASLTREQITSIQKAIPTLTDPREKCLIALLAYTSMRREEVLGLMWEHCNFEERYFEIRQAVVFPVNVAVTKETKNAYSERNFPMGDQLYNILLSCRKESGYVISRDDGSPISAATYQRMWKSLQSQIELYGMTAINFRTTFATMAVASGVDIKTTQTLMGHATPEMTLKVYAKKEESRLPDAMERMESFLAG